MDEIEGAIGARGERGWLWRRLRIALYEDGTVHITSTDWQQINNFQKFGKSRGAYETVPHGMDEQGFFSLDATCRDPSDHEPGKFMLDSYNPDSGDTYIALTENENLTGIVKVCGNGDRIARQEYYNSWNLLYERINEIAEATAH